MELSVRYLVALALVVLGLSLLLFSGARTAYAQLCDNSNLSGPITVTGYKGCSVPQRDWRDPKNPGTANAPCNVSGVQGGTITAFCSASKPCCELRNASGVDEALRSSGSGGIGGAGGVLQQMIQLLQQLMQGGGGSGSGGSETPGSPNFNYGTGGTDDTLLNLDENLTGNSGNELNFDAIFGENNDATESEATTEVKTEVNDDRDIDTYDDEAADDEGVDESSPAQEGDAVVTTYENAGNNNGATEPEAVTGPSGDDEFGFGTDTTGEFDTGFGGAYVDPGDDAAAGSGLSLEEIEAAGLLEAYRLGATREPRSGSRVVSYESLTPAEVRSLQDYESSGVAVSGRLTPFQGNPLSNEQYDSTREDTNGWGTNVLTGLARFVAALFGFGSPQN